MTWLGFLVHVFPQVTFFFFFLEKEGINKFALEGRALILLHREWIRTTGSFLGDPLYLQFFPFENIWTFRFRESQNKQVLYLWGPAWKVHLAGHSRNSIDTAFPQCSYQVQTCWKGGWAYSLAIVSREKVRWRKKEKLSILLCSR